MLPSGIMTGGENDDAVRVISALSAHNELVGEASIKLIDPLISKTSGQSVCSLE